MADEIALKIYIPSKVIADKKVYRAVVPYGGQRLTVMRGRAPVMLALDMGVISVLDENLQVVEEYLIANGAADVTENGCIILTEGAYNTKDLTLEKLHEMQINTPSAYCDWMVRYMEEKSKGLLHS